MKSLWRSFRGRFFYLSSLVFLTTVFANFLHYLFQFAMSRALGVADFGLLSAFTAIFTFLSLPGTALQTSASFFTSRLKAESASAADLRALAGRFYRQAGLLGGLGFLLVMAATPLISSLTRSPSPVLFTFYVALALVLWFAVSVGWGVLQGLQRFWLLSWSMIAFGAGRLALGVGLVAVGLGVAGALAATALGLVFSLALGLAPLGLAFMAQRRQGVPSLFYGYGLFAMAATLSLAVPTALDVLLVRFFFSEFDTGIYAMAAVLGKVVLLLPTGVSLVMFPMVSEAHFHRHATRHILHRALAYTSILAGGAAVIYVLLPGLLVGTLFGPDFLPGASLVRWYGLAMLPFSLVMVLARHEMAVAHVRYLAWLALYTGAEIGGILLFHGSLVQVAVVLGVVNLVFLVFSYWHATRRQPPDEGRLAE